MAARSKNKRPQARQATELEASRREAIRPLPLFPDDPEPRRFFQSFWRPAGVLIVFAIVVRLVQFLLIRANDPAFNQVLKGIDTWTYLDWARRIAAGDWLSRSEPVFYMGPLYAYFLAMVGKIFGDSYALVHAIQFGLGAASCGLVYAAGCQWFSRRVAFGAGMLLALCAPLLFYESLLLPEALNFLLLSGFVAMLAMCQRHGEAWWPWLLAGGVLGLAAIQRANALMCVGGVLLWVIIAFKDWPWSRRAARFGWLALGLVLALMPVTLHNRLIGGEWVLVTANGPVNLYLGNAPDGYGFFVYPPSYDRLLETRRELEARLTELKRQRSTGQDGGLDQSIEALQARLDGFWMQRLFESIGDEPLGWAGLMAKKVYLFWSGFDPPDNYSFAFHQRYSFLERYSPVRYTVLVCLGLAGMIFSRRRWRQFLPLYLFLGAFFVSVVVVFVSGRYRLPILIGLSLFASFAVMQMGVWWRRRRFRRLGGWILGLLLLGWLLNIWQPLPFDVRASDYTMTANYYNIGRQPERAIQMLEEGVAYFAGREVSTETEKMLQMNSIGQLKAGLAAWHMEAGRWAKAEEALKSLVEMRFISAGQLEMLVDALVHQDKRQEAAHYLQLLIDHDPDNTQWRERLEALREMLPDEKGSH